MLQRFERFTSSISAIYRDVQKIERDEMEKQGLRGAFTQYLLAMSRYPQGITAAILGEVCGKDKAAVSRIIAELEAKELIHKEADGTSHYRVRLFLTPKGQQVVAYIRQRASTAIELAGGGLPPEDRDAFYAALELLEDHLQKIAQQGLPE